MKKIRSKEVGLRQKRRLQYDVWNLNELTENLSKLRLKTCATCSAGKVLKKRNQCFKCWNKDKPDPKPKPKPEPKPRQTPKPFWFRLCTNTFTCDEKGQKPGAAECKEFIRAAKMIVIPEGAKNKEMIRDFVSINGTNQRHQFDVMPLAIDYYDENSVPSLDDMIIDDCIEKTFRNELYKPTDPVINLQRFLFK